VDGFRARLLDGVRQRHRRNARDAVGFDRVAPAGSERVGQGEIEPVILGVVGVLVRGPIVLRIPSLDHPREVRALALAPEFLGMDALGIIGIVLGEDRPGFGTARGRGVELGQEDPFAFIPALAFLMVDDMAFLQVHHQDAIGQRQRLRLLHVRGEQQGRQQEERHVRPHRKVCCPNTGIPRNLTENVSGFRRSSC